MSFRRRTFPEVLDSLLTTVTKGVAAEPHPFPPPGQSAPSYSHNLQQPPVAEIISVYGSKDGQPHTFRRDNDYKLVDQKRLVWQKAAELPDPGSLIYINYYPASAQPVLTDIYTGSVVRTLAETVAVEIAQLYAQLEMVYESGFIDTATGKSLDNVVSLLGISRIKADRPTGIVQFTRAQGSTGLVSIPAGTRITTKDGNVEYETMESAALVPTQNTTRVPARDLEANEPLPADSLVILPIPIEGIAQVTNPSATVISTRGETDEELRTRAKSFLHGSERATLGAIKQAVFRQGVMADVEETPGHITITSHADSMPPELYQRVVTAILDTKPAGISFTLAQGEPPRKVDLSLRIITDASSAQQDLRAAQHAVREKIEEYFARLPVKEEGSINRIIGLVLSVPQVKDVQVLDVSWMKNGKTESVLDKESGRIEIKGVATVLGELDIVDPNLPTALNVIVTYPKGQPPDKPKIQAALSKFITYLNNLQPISELPEAEQENEKAKRWLAYGRMLYVTPLPLAFKPGAKLPDKPELSTAEIDAMMSDINMVMPMQEDAKPYTLSFIFTQQSGLSRILSKAMDTPYQLSDYERLSLSGVESKEIADA